MPGNETFLMNFLMNFLTHGNIKINIKFTHNFSILGYALQNLNFLFIFIHFFNIFNKGVHACSVWCVAEQPKLGCDSVAFR